MFKLILSSIFLFSFVIAHPLFADSKADNINKSLNKKKVIDKLKNDFANKKEDIKETREAIKLLDLESFSLKQNLENLGDSKKVFEKEHAELSDELIKLDERKNIVTQKINSLSKKAGIDTKNLNKRLVSFYKLSRQSSFLSFFMSSESAVNFQRRERFLKRVINKDLDLISKLDKELLSQQTERLELFEIEKQNNQNLNKLRVLSKKIEKKLFEQRALQKSIDSKKVNFKERLASLEKSSKELEKTLVGVMGQNKKEKADFKKVNLAKLKGRLKPPVFGEVVQKYGKKRHKEFSDVLIVKGIEYFVKPGQKVKAIAPGEVVLRQKLPEYGNVLILDHGLRYYSLYGRLASFSVSLGEIVESGQVLAELDEVNVFDLNEDKLLSNTDSNFYFELRKRGKAIDPEEYFEG